MSISILSHTRFLPMLIAATVISCSSAFAASPCKGISENACSASGECTWVNGYTRKDGRSVSSYCKLRGRKKADQSAKANDLKVSAAIR